MGYPIADAPFVVARRTRTRRTPHTTPYVAAMSAAGYELRGIYGTEPYWPEKKLKICITGAGGFIASHLAMRLKQEGHHIVACDWKRNEHMEVCCCFVCDTIVVRIVVLR